MQGVQEDKVNENNSAECRHTQQKTGKVQSGADQKSWTVSYK